MDWSVVGASPEKIAFAQALLKVTPRLGWGRPALRAAARMLGDDPQRWQALFPRGAVEAIWFISDASDASMRSAFARHPAAGMAEVILVRLEQNAELKPFVRKVMAFDMRHPFQALARMQRTARVMFDCAGRRPGRLALSVLNIVYTGLVWRWLLDRSPANRRTRAATVRMMKLLRL